MSKIKKHQEKTKISLHKNEVPENDNCLLLSFKYLTSNKDFTYLKPGLKIKALIDLNKKYEEICSTSLVDLQQRSKTQGGLETLEKSQFNQSLFRNYPYDLTNDTKVSVIRFGGNKYRLIFLKSKTMSNALNILGFDWDYSAYNHGK